MSQPAATCAHCGLPTEPVRDGADAFCCMGCRLVHKMLGPRHAAGDSAEPDDATHETPRRAVAANPLLLRLGTGIFLTMNMLALGDYFYSREAYRPTIAGGERRDYELVTGIFSHALLLMCTIVLLVLGGPLAREAWDGLTRTRVGADGVARRRPRVDSTLLIVIGVAAAYAVSVAHTLRGAGGLYYDTAGMILVLVTLGAYLESGAKSRAARAVEAFFATLPTRAWVERDGAWREADADSLRAGDRVRVRPGETIPADGVVALGEGHVNESSLTGESAPRAAGAGAKVWAGSIALDGVLTVAVTAAGEERVIARVRHMLDAARLEKPPVQRLADRASAHFIPLVLALAVGVLAWHAWRGDPTRGLFDALSVLLISCPCALGLSAPLATWSALGRLAARGVLVGSAATLERAAEVTRVILDKTGTLTTSRMSLVAVRLAPGGTLTADEAIALAAAVESASTHPIALGIVAEATRRGLRVEPVEASRVLPGRGVEARVNGRWLQVGNDRLRTGSDAAPSDASERAATVRERSGVGDACQADHSLTVAARPEWHAPGTSPRSDDTATTVCLVEAGRVLAAFDLREELRADAADAIARLRRAKVEVEVLTGDAEAPAEALSRRLGVEVRWGLLPGDKLDGLRRRRAAGDVVMMVGDGINDAPVLAGADVGVAMGGGADLARQAGNVHLLSDRLDRVADLLHAARDTRRRIWLNLAWSFGYNVIGLCLAATGRLGPIFAASAMVFSSVVVVLVSRGAGALGEDTVSDPVAGPLEATAPAAPPRDVEVAHG